MASFCDKCGEPVRWVKTASGKNLMLNEGSDDDGNVVIVRDVATVLGQRDAEFEFHRGSLLFRPHFTTCSSNAEAVPMPDSIKQRLAERKARVRKQRKYS